jgi:S-ribosylhomocysteine lyase
MNVESFNLDHRTVAAPYVRLADTKVLPAGDVISKFDIRFTQPNKAHLEMPTVHSLEHLFAEHSRNHSDRVIDFSPMGCQTGFYLILEGRWESEDVQEGAAREFLAHRAEWSQVTA